MFAVFHPPHQAFPPLLAEEFTGLAILLAVLSLAAVAVLASFRQRGIRLQSSPTGFSAPPDASREELCGDLVQGLIGTYDLSDSEVVRAHVQKSLRGAGITEIRPNPGDSFNPREHNGVAAVRAPVPALAFRIARVLRPGWKSAKGTVRPADVEVYKED